MKFVLSLFILFSIACPAWAVDTDDETPIVLRSPASDEEAPVVHDKAEAFIESFVDNKTFKARGQGTSFEVGEIVAVESKTKDMGVVGFVQVSAVDSQVDGSFIVTCTLLRQSRTNFLQPGDKIFRLDLSSDNNHYKGTTDLIIRKQNPEISAKYKPLFTLGTSAGETAETLWQHEYLVTWYGLVAYGVFDWMTIETVAPADFLHAENLAAKFRMYNSDSNILSSGFSLANIPNQNSATLNVNFFWDSISTEKVIQHTYLTIALYSFSQAQDTTAVKSLGTSSLQTGYEYILDNWDRVLIGPSFNFEKKAVGGYIGYLKIWDRFHFGVSLNSTSITSFKVSPTDGYYVLFDAYWRL